MSKGESHRLRRGRVSEAGRIYLVTTSTYNRLPLFTHPATARRVVQILGCERFADTICYCLMPDHLHWLLQLDGRQPLSKVMARIKGVSARAVRMHAGSSGPVWQAGFHDRAVRREEEVRDLARYVIANPVRAGLVSSVRDYPHWDAMWL